MKDTYVQAALEIISTGREPEELISQLQRVMGSRGHERLLAPVLRAVARELSASRAQRTVVSVADETAYQEYEAAIKQALAALGSHDTPTVVTDETLIGGYQVEANYHRVDASYKQQLVSLYRNITTR